METEPLIELMVDGNSKKPLCVNLQAILGNGHNNSFLQRVFDVNHWSLSAQSPRRVKGTREQWEKHSKWLQTQ